MNPWATRDSAVVDWLSGRQRIKEAAGSVFGDCVTDKMEDAAEGGDG